jgi:hypothetical protein
MHSKLLIGLILFLAFGLKSQCYGQRNEIGLAPFKIQKDIYSDTAFKAKFMTGLYYKWNSDLFTYSATIERGKHVLRENCLICPNPTSSENRVFLLKELNARLRFGIKKDFASFSIGSELGAFFSRVRREYSWLSASYKLTTSAIHASIYAGELNLWLGYRIKERFSIQLETSFLLGTSQGTQISSSFSNSYENKSFSEFNSAYSSWVLPALRISYLF